MLPGTVSVSAHNAHTLSHDKMGSSAAPFASSLAMNGAAAVPECAAAGSTDRPRYEKLASGELARLITPPGPRNALRRRRRYRRGSRPHGNQRNQRCPSGNLSCQIARAVQPRAADRFKAMKLVVDPLDNTSHASTCKT